MTLKTWLCVGNKKDYSDKCINCETKIKTEYHGLWQTPVQVLIVYCNKLDRYVNKWKTECEYFANRTL